MLDSMTADSQQYPVVLCLQNSFILFRGQNHTIFKKTKILEYIVVLSTVQYCHLFNQQLGKRLHVVLSTV